MKKKEQQPHMNLRAELRRVESRQQDACAELNRRLNEMETNITVLDDNDRRITGLYGKLDKMERRLDALDVSALAHDHALEMMGKGKEEHAPVAERERRQSYYLVMSSGYVDYLGEFTGRMRAETEVSSAKKVMGPAMVMSARELVELRDRVATLRA